MVDKSGPTPFCAIFESVLQTYEEQAGVILTKDPLAIQVQNCDSVDAINAMRQGQVKALTDSDFQRSDGVLKSMKNITLSLSSVFVTACESLGDAISLATFVCQNSLVARPIALTHLLQPSPPIKAVHASLAILLDVCGLGCFLCW